MKTSLIKGYYTNFTGAPKGYRILRDEEIILRGDRCLGAHRDLEFRNEIKNWQYVCDSIGRYYRDTKNRIFVARPI